MAYVQSKCGPRFFIPKKCIPGLYEYSVKIDKLSDEEKGRGCPICLFELTESPLTDPDAEVNGATAPLLKKPKFVYKTPCGHIFHAPCLKNWMNLKADCPSCRGALPDYY